MLTSLSLLPVAELSPAVQIVASAIVKAGSDIQVQLACGLRDWSMMCPELRGSVLESAPQLLQMVVSAGSAAASGHVEERLQRLVAAEAVARALASAVGHDARDPTIAKHVPTVCSAMSTILARAPPSTQRNLVIKALFEFVAVRVSTEVSIDLP